MAVAAAKVRIKGWEHAKGLRHESRLRLVNRKLSMVVHHGCGSRGIGGIYEQQPHGCWNVGGRYYNEVRWRHRRPCPRVTSVSQNPCRQGPRRPPQTPARPAYLSIYPDLLDRNHHNKTLKITGLVIHWLTILQYNCLLSILFNYTWMRKISSRDSAMPLWHCTAASQKSELLTIYIGCSSSPVFTRTTAQGTAMSWLLTISCHLRMILFCF